ncbi:hypothetical protein BWQ96_06294 [Gracilariopsis chorda]|uniref:Uncharacterized protein n=1 Tax=Gracilariopsis chorda TaxID=448386 RepID=A0A2V3IPB1_9FLOR|nr:hypothetical protein BWQ96_06294 [Gracilariopsis chorda]|eukprot:PXF43925.1 hypothetical protein BWQ96_06294 [Gracilariopsis chorda]
MAPRTLSATCDGWHTFNATIFDPVRIAAIAHLRYAPMRERGAIIMKGVNAAEFRVAHHSASGLWDIIPTVNSSPSSQQPLQSALTASLASATASESPNGHSESPQRKGSVEPPMLLPNERAVMSAVKRSATHRRFAITLIPNRHFMLHPSATGSRHFVLCELHAGPSIISSSPRTAQHPSDFEHNHDDENDDGVQVASFTCDGVWKRSYSIHIERLIPDELVVFCFWLVNLMNRRANRADPTHAAHASTKG